MPKDNKQIQSSGRTPATITRAPGLTHNSTGRPSHPFIPRQSKRCPTPEAPGSQEGPRTHTTQTIICREAEQGIEMGRKLNGTSLRERTGKMEVKENTQLHLVKLKCSIGISLKQPSDLSTCSLANCIQAPMCNHLRVAVPLNFLNLYISMSDCGLLEYKMFKRKKKSCNKWSEACEVVQAGILSCTAANMSHTPHIYQTHHSSDMSVPLLPVIAACHRCLSFQHLHYPRVHLQTLGSYVSCSRGVMSLECAAVINQSFQTGVFGENSFSSPQISALFLP